MHVRLLAARGLSRGRVPELRTLEELRSADLAQGGTSEPVVPHRSEVVPLQRLRIEADRSLSWRQTAYVEGESLAGEAHSIRTAAMKMASPAMP